MTDPATGLPASDTNGSAHDVVIAALCPYCLQASPHLSHIENHILNSSARQDENRRLIAKMLDAEAKALAKSKVK